MSVGALRHTLFLYASDGELGERMAGFLEGGLDEGDVAAVVATPPHRELLEDALGAASDEVVFFDPRGHYARPEAALAGYDATLRRMVAEGARGVRMFAEMPFDFRDESLPRHRWMAYEAIFNRAFAHHPLWIACGFDERTTPEPVVDDLLRAHPEVIEHGAPRPCEHYADASEIVRTLAPEPVPLPDLPELELGLASDPRRLRGLLA
ncbi:MAG: MEDS domain-containing protein, partial [Solirubrobacteraceae bacterium]